MEIQSTHSHDKSCKRHKSKSLSFSSFSRLNNMMQIIGEDYYNQNISASSISTVMSYALKLCIIPLSCNWAIAWLTLKSRELRMIMPSDECKSYHYHTNQWEIPCQGEQRAIYQHITDSCIYNEQIIFYMCDASDNIMEMFETNEHF